MNKLNVLAQAQNKARTSFCTVNMLKDEGPSYYYEPTNGIIKPSVVETMRRFLRMDWRAKSTESDRAFTYTLTRKRFVQITEL